MAKDELNEFRLIGTRPDRPDGLDKVTGRARYGADITAPGMLWGAVVRSPHAHARIVKIDASRALALDGVKAVVTRADFPTGLTGEEWNLQENTMAGEKALYDGHAVAAVAATSALLAQEAARLVEVDYEVLPHVTDVDLAMAPDAPVIRDGACVPGKKMYLSVSIDHRLVDGATGAHWMNIVKDNLEQPYRMLLS